jgi:hypothetical protein
VAQSGQIERPRQSVSADHFDILLWAWSQILQGSLKDIWNAEINDLSLLFMGSANRSRRGKKLSRRPPSPLPLRRVFSNLAFLIVAIPSVLHHSKTI